MSLKRLHSRYLLSISFAKISGFLLYSKENDTNVIKQERI